MRLLLDTHSFLWFTANAPQLSGNAKSLIENPENEVLLSIINIWEIAILISLGRIVSQSLSKNLFAHSYE